MHFCSQYGRNIKEGDKSKGTGQMRKYSGTIKLQEKEFMSPINWIHCGYFEYNGFSELQSIPEIFIGPFRQVERILSVWLSVKD